MPGEPRPGSQDQRTLELEVFADSSRLVASTLDLGEVLDRLAALASVRLGVDLVRIWLVESSSGELVLGSQTGVVRDGKVGWRRRFTPGEGLVGWVMENGTPLTLVDVLSDPRLKNREWFEAEGVTSVMAVPIILDMAPIGAIACMSRTRREFSPADVALAAAVAAPAATAVRNAGLYTEALERLEEIQAFQRVTSETLSSPDLETALRAIVRETQHLLRSDAAFCSIVEPETLDVETVVTVGARSQAFPRYRLASSAGMAGHLRDGKRPLRTDDYVGDTRFARTPEMEAWARGEGTVAMIGAPVLDPGGQVIALLWAYNRTPTSFAARHEERLVALGQQAALAIGKARGFEEERRRARETSALLEIARACGSTLELRPLLREIAERAAQALRFDRCSIFLWSDGRIQPVMSQFADPDRRSAELWRAFKAVERSRVEEIAAFADAARRRAPVVIQDTAGSTLIPSSWVEVFGLARVLVVPLIAKDEVVGTLLLDRAREADPIRQDQLGMAMTVAAQVALAVENAGHFDEAQRRAAEVETLAAVGETLTSTLDIEFVLDAIADSATKLIGAQRAAVFEVDAGARCLRARAVRGVGVEIGFTLRIGQGVTGSAALRLAPVWSADIDTQRLPGFDEPYQDSGMTLRERMQMYGCRAILAVPVVTRDKVLGAVVVYWDEVHEPDQREIRLLSALARQAGIAMENASLVADLKQTLDDLKVAQDGLVRGATLRAVGELAAGAAHHINNLMAVVLGRTQLLLMRDVPDSMRESLKTIERSVVAAGDTVRRIQAFSRTDSELKPDKLDLNTLVREGIELTRSRWQEEARLRSAEIGIAFEPGAIPSVPGRAGELRDVIINLILNAVDALPTGGRIGISTRHEAGRAIVRVRDSGVGMADEAKRRAFEPFFTTKGVKSTGLGLAVVYGTIRRHAGEIELESSEGQGTTVTISLPVMDAGEAGPVVEPKTPRPLRILAIDDEGDVRDLVGEALSAEGYEVTLAATGPEGLARFQEGPHDLVITDLGMPGVTGWDVVRSVKGRRPGVPVLLLTGWGDSLDVPDGIRVDGVITKPFNLDRLAAAVSDALAARSRAG